MRWATRVIFSKKYLHVSQNKSIRYLVPDAVEDYIRRHSLHLLPNWQHS